MSQREKEELVDKVATLAMKDVLELEDGAAILRICRDACERRLAEIDAEVSTPVGKVQ